MSKGKDFRLWSHGRQFLSRRGSSCEQVLRGVVGVYSAHPTGPLSLFARVKSFSDAAFFRLDDKRLALRVPAMRQSIYMLPTDTARLAVAATILPPSDPYWEKRYSQKGRAIPKDNYKRWHSQILKLAKRPMSAARIKDALEIPDATIKTVLNRMSFEGSVLRVGIPNLRASALNYVATKSWVKDHRPAYGGEKGVLAESLEWLAGQYLRAFGPARVKDFQWWAGVTATQAEKAIAGIETVSIENKHLLLAKDLRAFESFKRPKKDTLDLLPRWDSYTMGYAPDGRKRFVDPDVQHHIYGSIGATTGNALGVVLVNGLAHGSWSSRFQAARMVVSLSMFARPSQQLTKRITSEFNKVATLLGAHELTIEREKTK